VLSSTSSDEFAIIPAMAFLRKDLFLGLVVIGLFVLGVCAGSEWISPWRFIVQGEVDPIVELRAMRMLAALVAGGALALSGATFQVVLRNPLAEPFTLGLSGGAGVGATLAFVLGLRALSVYAVPACALVGALVVLGLVLFVSRGGARGDGSLLLSGVIAGTISGSLLIYILSVARVQDLANVTWWMLGDLQSIDLVLLMPTLVILIVSLVLLRFFAGDMNILSLGNDTAWGFGVSVRTLTILLILVGAMLAASTVAMAGIIGFCGLIIPHVVRTLYGCDHRKIVFKVFLFGAAFLMACDILSRSVYVQREIPIGVITALVGGPLFLWILNSRKM